MVHGVLIKEVSNFGDRVIRQNKDREVGWGADIGSAPNRLGTVHGADGTRWQCHGNGVAREELIG
jgi:hypothetical protein